jgi:hypothetical protein
MKLAVEGLGVAAETPQFTLTVSKLTPKLSVSNVVSDPSLYKTGYGIIRGHFSFTGYEKGIAYSKWVLEKKSGSKWKSVPTNIYTSIETFDTDSIKIGSPVTYRLRFIGDENANGVSASFSMYKSKITVKVTGKKTVKAYKKVKLTAKLNKKTSGVLTVYFKGKSIGSLAFKNKKSVKLPITFYGSGKGKLYVKYTSGTLKYKNATSKKITVRVKR